MRAEAFDAEGHPIKTELIPPRRTRRGVMKIKRVTVRVARAAQHPLSRLFAAVALDVAKGVVRNLGKK